MQRHSGFTLIEVLIALAILSIALTAIIKATAQNIRNTAYLQNKTLAAWVAEEVINETRVGLLKLPLAPDQLEQETHMLHQTWQWRAYLTPTANPHINEIHVSVQQPDTDAVIVNLMGYEHAT
jgi:general secretion pathway protein I